MNDIQAIAVRNSRDCPAYFYGVHDLGANLSESFWHSLRRYRDKPRVRRGSPRTEHEDVVAARDKAIGQIRDDRLGSAVILWRNLEIGWRDKSHS
jgi:hypothetical protein